MVKIHHYCAWCVRGLRSKGFRIFTEYAAEEGPCEQCGEEDVELYDCIFEED